MIYPNQIYVGMHNNEFCVRALSFDQTGRLSVDRSVKDPVSSDGVHGAAVFRMIITSYR